MSKAEDQKKPGQSAAEQMSTADLEELLLRDFYSEEGGRFDMGELYQAAQALAEQKGYADSEADRSWERFCGRRFAFGADAVRGGEDGSMPSSDAALGRRHSPCSQRRLWRVAAMAVFAGLLLSISAAAGGVWKGTLALRIDEK